MNPTGQLKLLFVGDVMLGRLVNDVLRDEPPTYPWGDTWPFFREADWRACNLECVISDRGSPWTRTPKAFHFRSDAKNVAVLKAAGINAVPLANNHTLDYGHRALFDMLTQLYELPVELSAACCFSVQTTSPLDATVTKPLKTLSQMQVEFPCPSP